MPELRDVIESRTLFRWLSPHDVSGQLERHVEKRFAVAHALATHNCTQAIRLVLLGTRPSAGDLVYLPAVTFVATAGAVLSAGLIPVLVDVGPDLTLDPALLPQTAERVIVVHIEGTRSVVPEGVPFVLEDVGQALGGSHPDGTAFGAAGNAGVFSFNHNKVLSSGEGGLVVTDDDELAERIKQFHDHGSQRVQGHYPTWAPGSFFGDNLVANEIVAAVQLQQFRHLDEVIDGLRRNYDIVLDAVRDNDACAIVPRSDGDPKLSLKLEFESREVRDRAVQVVGDHGMHPWPLDRYFLPDHPVLADRRSIYADGFPWSLRDGGSLPVCTRDGFAGTRELIGRTLCVRMAPETSERENMHMAEQLRLALKRI
jgi:8-amino-3,8-dideoxy-alpha-D-manno-octulosonate transaminase